jgi:hypothetical protein
MARAVEYTISQLPWIGLGLVIAGVVVGVVIAMKWREK